MSPSLHPFAIPPLSIKSADFIEPNENLLIFVAKEAQREVKAI
jgi:hypothetical protein